MTIKLICIENLVNPEIKHNVGHEPTRFAQLRIGVEYELEEFNETQYKIIGPAFARPAKGGYAIFDKTYFAESMPVQTKEVAGEKIAAFADDMPF